MTESAEEITHFEKRKSSLATERSSFISHWKELSEYISPRRGRFFVQDRNRGDKRNKKIINSRATMALRTLSSGMMAGITSPARPWFRLGTPDRDLMEFAPVKLWLEKVELLLREIFNQSNLYNALPQIYSELGGFGTAALGIVEDFDDVIRCYPYTIGSYMLGQSDKLEINTFYREYQMTVGQIVEQFVVRSDGEMDWSKASVAVKTLWDNGSVDSWVTVVQAIEPNIGRDAQKRDSGNKRYVSAYYEPGGDKNEFLSRRGFDDFPVMAPRWETTAEDVYGTNCPGMIALGDIKGLQLEEKRKAQAIDKMTNPPLRGPASLRNSPVSSLPGGLTLFDQGQETGGGLAPIYEVNPRINELMQDINNIENRIDRCFYADLFMMLENLDGVQPRNILELSQRKEEKLLQLGPVLEDLHNDFLDKIIDRTFNIAERGGLIPPAPEELQGSPLRVEYISILAQAQQAVGTASIERLSGFIGGLAAVYPSVADKFDADQAVDEYSELIGTSPKIVVSDDTVKEIRAARQQQQAQQQALDTAQQGAATAKVLSETKVGGGQDVLTRMTGL